MDTELPVLVKSSINTFLNITLNISYDSKYIIQNLRNKINNKDFYDIRFTFFELSSIYHISYWVKHDF